MTAKTWAFKVSMTLGIAGLLLGTNAYAANGVVNSGQSTTSSNSVVTMDLTVPHIVEVRVNSGTSTLGAGTLAATRINTGSDAAGVDYQIRGNVYANDPTDVIDMTLDTLAVVLTDGAGHTITNNLSGTIGGTAVATTTFNPTFAAGAAAIVVDGDIDESTITATDIPGNYAGAVTITATIH